MGRRRAWVVLIILAGLLALVAPYVFFRSRAQFVSLTEIPRIDPAVLNAQGRLFRVEEPILFDRKTGLGVYVIEILSKEKFEDESHIVFGGDAQSLLSFAHEVELVNQGPSRIANAATGVGEGATGLVSGLWQLVRHPIDTVTGLGSAAVGLIAYLKDTSSAQIKSDVKTLAETFYINRACEVAQEHAIDYFDLKTEHGKSVVHSETSSRLGGQATLELATLLVPFSKLKYAGEAVSIAKATEGAVKAAETATIAERMVQAGTLSQREAKFARSCQFFPQMAEKMALTLRRLEHAVKPRAFNLPLAQLGKAASLDYKATFFASHPDQIGKVVVHHAIPQQVLKNYPNLLTEWEIHSLENLRGIPKSLDATLHKSNIAKEWNEFYRMNPASSVTKQKLIDQASAIDQKFGHLFEPKLL